MVYKPHTGRNTELQARAVIAIWTVGVHYTCSIRTVAFSFPISDSCSHAPSKLSPPSLSVTICKQHTRCQPRGRGAIPATLTHLCRPHRSRQRLVRPLPWLPAAASCWSRWRRVTSHWPPTAATSGSQLCHLGPQPAKYRFQHVTCSNSHTSARHFLSRALKAASATIAMPCGRKKLHRSSSFPHWLTCAPWL